MSCRCIFPWGPSWTQASVAAAAPATDGALLCPAISPNQSGIYELEWNVSATGAAKTGNVAIFVNGSQLPGVGRIGSNSSGSVFAELGQTNIPVELRALLADALIPYTVNLWKATLIGRTWACYELGQEGGCK